MSAVVYQKTVRCVRRHLLRVQSSAVQYQKDMNSTGGHQSSAAERMKNIFVVEEREKRFGAHAFVRIGGGAVGVCMSLDLREGLPVRPVETLVARTDHHQNSKDIHINTLMNH